MAGIDAGVVVRPRNAETRARRGSLSAAFMACIACIAAVRRVTMAGDDGDDHA